MSISSLIDKLRELDNFSRLLNIPDDLCQELDIMNQKIDAFLRASQEEFDSRKRNESMDNFLLLLWRTFFNNIVQKIIGEHETFPIYHTCMIRKEHAKDVIRNDFHEKLQAIHEMLLKSWPHMVPPLFEDINFPAGRLKNEMLLASWDDGIEPEWGFVEPPSLKPNARPRSVEEYLKSDYLEKDRSVRDDIVFLANHLAGLDGYDPREQDPTFMGDFMVIHGNKRYSDVSRMFPTLHSKDEYS